MGRIVFVLLLASCFATGLGLECYQCVSGPSLLVDGIGSLPFFSNGCGSDSFDPDGVDTVNVTGSVASGFSFLKPAYCIQMVVNIGDIAGVTMRIGINSSAIINPMELITENFLSGIMSSRLNSDDLLNNQQPEDLMEYIQEFLGGIPSALGGIDVTLCSENLCNSVSGLRHSNAVLAMSVVVLMATLANTFN